MEPDDDDEALEAWIDLQPVGLRDTLRENRAFAVQRFKQSRPVVAPVAPVAPAASAAPAAPAAPPVEQPEGQEEEPQQEEGQEEASSSAAGSKRPHKRSFWTSRRGDPTFSVSRSTIRSAIARQKLSKEEKDDLKRQNIVVEPDPLSTMRLNDGSVDISLDPVVEVSSALFVECGDDDDAGCDSLAAEAEERSERRRRSRLIPGASSKDGSTSNLEVRLVHGIQTLLTQNLIHTDASNADRPLESYLRTPSPIAVGVETSSTTETVPETANTSGKFGQVPPAPPPTPVHRHRLVVTQPLPVVDEDSSDSEDDVNPHTVYEARARAIAARNRTRIR